MLGTRLSIDSTSEAVGAYGFRLVPGRLNQPLPDLVRAPAEWQPVAVSWAHASALHDVEEVRSDRVRLGARGKGVLTVDRVTSEMALSLPDLPTAESVVHPLSTLPLAFLAHWSGRATLHGGAFVHDGRAWVVSGAQLAGKSSLLAALGERGTPILADDLVVIDGAHVLAGPDCVDLRPDAAPRFPASRSIGVVAGRERFRLATTPSPAACPLGGICELRWDDDGTRAEVTALSVPESLSLLHAQHYAATLGPPDPLTTLALLDTPIVRFTRPRGWDGADAALDRLLFELERL